MRLRLWLIALIAFALPLEPEVHPAAASGPATLTVHIVGGATKTALYLQPGFATVLRADHRIDTVGHRRSNRALPAVGSAKAGYLGRRAKLQTRRFL